jgi:rare lipoprotein A
MKVRIADVRWMALPLVLALGACTLNPPRPDPARRPPQTTPPAQGRPAEAPLPAPDKEALVAARAAPAAPAVQAARPGGYYQDDGPARDTPENLDRIPDAVPRLEPINRNTARPYEVLGRSYTPYATLKPFRQRGIASWYGKKYHGRKTSSGEPYDMFAMTAAHTVLPLPSYLRVTNPANGRQVVVRVNDRGPFHKDRIVDLSYTAAHKLGLIGKGSGEVEIEQIIPGENDAPPVLAQKPADPPPKPDGAKPEAAKSLDQLIAQIPKDDGPLLPGVYIQLGAFGNPDNAENLRNILGRELEWLSDPIRIVPAGAIQRVQVGPYPDRATAERVAARIVDEMGGKPGFVTR